MSEPIRVKLKLFASLRQVVGQASFEREVASGTTLGQLVSALSNDYPQLPTAAGAIYAAVNRAYASDGVVLQDGDEVALFPPVSGGQAEAVPKRDQPPRLFEITDRPLLLDEIAARVSGASRGAITLFAGVVRGETATNPHHPGQPLQTSYLEYEAFVEMAEPMLAQIGDEVLERWPQIEAIAIVHRIGRLEIGEASVVIAVAAPHRRGTFDACSYAIERLKAVVPIWKKEVGEDGQWWVEGPRAANEATPIAAQEEREADRLS